MQYLSLVGWIFLCQSVGIVGGIATSQSVNSWYRTLRKPSFNPPSGVFGPVWTILYLLMAISMWLVWMEPGSILATVVFVVQLALNLMWSIVFFSLKNPKAALATLLTLDVAVLATMFVFFAFSPMAGWLMVPYFAWCMFATVLNEEIVRLNPPRI